MARKSEDTEKTKTPSDGFADTPDQNAAPSSDSSPQRDPSPYGSGNRRQINDLIRTYSAGLTRSASNAGPDVNPFLDSNPLLDPNSPDFDAIEWAKALLKHSSAYPDRYPRPQVGVAYKSLSVHGFGRDTDFQKNVLNVLLQGPMIAKEWISQRQQKIDILRNFDGLVRSGEMLLVLGRPGR